jgi:hypothetical protein
MTKHCNTSSSANYSNCDQEIPARRTVCFAEKMLFNQCNKEGSKKCQKKWARIESLLLCKLCKATVENPRVSSDSNKWRKQTKNKWYTKEHHENLEPKAECNEHKEAIYICAMCMSDNLEIL